uniref:BAH domain-containing protein n=1 Tax=Rhizophagus irregularis (strain DAOM 181602 / DAOM 197198 / MUCL 43194) TaxID=747089 RepID=U9UWH7_RHIID
MEITDDTTTYATDHGICFGKVLLLGEIFVNNLHNITFAMVKWYDYSEQDNEDLEICGCPRLKLLKDYDIVPLDSIKHSVHIIPRFHKKINFYFLQ